jgi:hypothetical protein
MRTAPSRRRSERANNSACRRYPGLARGHHHSNGWRPNPMQSCHAKIVLAAVVLAWSLGASAIADGFHYPPGTKLTVAITCPKVPASDPVFSFSFTNAGTDPVDINQQVPVDFLVQLTIKDGHGNIVPAGSYNSGSRRPVPPKVLEPGHTMTLDDWVRQDAPRTSLIPAHLFGYTLAPGKYSVSADAIGEPDAPASNVCTVDVI